MNILSPDEYPQFFQDFYSQKSQGLPPEINTSITIFRSPDKKHCDLFLSQCGAIEEAVEQIHSEFSERQFSIISIHVLDATWLKNFDPEPEHYSLHHGLMAHVIEWDGRQLDGNSFEASISVDESGHLSDDDRQSLVQFSTSGYIQEIENRVSLKKAIDSMTRSIMTLSFPYVVRKSNTAVAALAWCEVTSNLRSQYWSLRRSFIDLYIVDSTKMSTDEVRDSHFYLVSKMKEMPTPIGLSVDHKNTKARRLYERMGFNNCRYIYVRI